MSVKEKEKIDNENTMVENKITRNGEHLERVKRWNPFKKKDKGSMQWYKDQCVLLYFLLYDI